MTARARIRITPTRLLAGHHDVLHRILVCLIPACLIGACLIPALLLGSPAFSAQTASPVPPSSPYTLHAYEDLLQLPTLVLNSAGTSYEGLTAAQFTLQLDGGPPFHPRHIRLQGDDPLQVALVFDTGQKGILPLAQMLEEIAPAKLKTWLSPADNLSVYALDCHLIRSGNSLPYSAARLQESLARALAAADLHEQTTGAACGAKRRLWDSVAVVISQLSQLPGRRLVLIVSDGLDDTSQMSWTTLAHYAGRFNTTLMGLRVLQRDSRSSDLSQRLPSFTPATERLVREDEDVFGLLCGETGGIVLCVNDRTMHRQMNSTIKLIHQRYILEFSRPRNGIAGLYHVDVSIPDRHAVVLAAGIGFPPRNPGQDTGPGNIPSDPARAPQLGDRKILTQPQ